MFGGPSRHCERDERIEGIGDGAIVSSEDTTMENWGFVVETFKIHINAVIYDEAHGRGGCGDGKARERQVEANNGRNGIFTEFTKKQLVSGNSDGFGGIFWRR